MRMPLVPAYLICLHESTHEGVEVRPRSSHAYELKAADRQKVFRLGLDTLLLILQQQSRGTESNKCIAIQ